MVYLHFPSQSTEEEEMLKKKYEKLRRKKKALQMLNAPKQEPPPPPKPLAKPLEAKPDAKEVAKKLLKSGAISAIKVENKERQGFKRPKALERKRNACDKAGISVAGYQPFTASNSLEDDSPSMNSPTDSASSSPSNNGRPQVKKLYESFVSSRKPVDDEVREEHSKDKDRREQNRDGKPERPRQGNTVYVRGYGVTQEILQTTLEGIGNIVNISMEPEKNCGFVTFEKIEEADKAIRDVSGVIADGIRLNVSLARRQPLIPSLRDDSSSSWSTLAVNFPQKGNHDDTRDLIAYEDI